MSHRSRDRRRERQRWPDDTRRERARTMDQIDRALDEGNETANPTAKEGRHARV